MKGRALIDWTRRLLPGCVMEIATAENPHTKNPERWLIPRETAALLADAVEIADEAARALIECESLDAGGWWDTRYAINGLGDYNEVDECDPINKALSYLDRRGLIERHPDNPNLVRFVDA